MSMITHKPLSSGVQKAANPPVQRVCTPPPKTLRPPFVKYFGENDGTVMCMRKLIMILDFARSRSAVFSLGEASLGALLAFAAIPSARVILLGLLAAMAGYFCVYALNDLMDLKSDRREIELKAAQPEEVVQEAQLDIIAVRHPIAAGALSLWAGVAVVAILAIIGFTAAYLLNPLCAWLFVVCALLEVLYCSLRHHTWLKIIPAGVMVSVGGLAGWYAVGSKNVHNHAISVWGALAFFILLLVWEIAGRNLSNDLADVEHDRLVGIKTLSATHGTASAAKAIVAGSFLMPIIALLQPSDWPIRVILAVIAVATMTWPSVLMYTRGAERNAQRYFNRASLFPAISAGCLIIYWGIAALVR